MKSNILLVLLFGFLVSCHKDTDIITVDDTPDPTPVLVTTKLVSQNDTTTSATELASQRFGGNSDTYSYLPYIVADGSLVNRDFELARLETKDGLTFYHVETLIENDVNYLHWYTPEITFLPANSSTEFEIDLVPGIHLDIPSNSIQNQDGTTYTGSYKIAFALLDPLTSDVEAIPSYTGIRDHQHVALQFQQCIYLNVLGEANEKLKFTKGLVQFTSTPNLDMWAFNTEKAAWTTEEAQPNHSEIQLGTSIYYGTATANPAVRMSGTFTLNNKLTPHQELQLSYGSTSRKIYTTNTGAWAAIVPTNTSCTVEAYLPCETKFTHTFNSPAISFHVPLAVNQEPSVNTAYTGTMRDNEADALNGIILVSGEQPNFYYADDPDFSFNVPTCLGDMNGLQGLDIATGQSGPVIYWEAADSIEVYSVFACELANYEYLSLEISGEGKMYWDLKTSTQASRLIIEEGTSEGELDLSVWIKGMEQREYQNTELNILFEDMDLGSRGYSMYCPTSPYGCGFTKFVITHFPAQQGEWIRGYFEGTFWIKTFHPLTGGYRPVKGEFQVFRDF